MTLVRTPTENTCRHVQRPPIYGSLFKRRYDILIPVEIIYEPVFQGPLVITLGVFVIYISVISNFLFGLLDRLMKGREENNLS